MKRSTWIGLWLSAFLLTAILVVYQRTTGPTYPIRGKEILAGKTFSYRFLRSHTTGTPLLVSIQIPAAPCQGKVYFRRFKSGDDWKAVDLAPASAGSRLQASVPGQPAAGKIEYRVQVSDGAQEWMLLSGRSIVARFKNRVPGWLLIIHVLFMFSGMLFAFRAGMEAFRPQGHPAGFVTLTLLLIVVGGLIMGPVIQKIAFGSFWTGFPLGNDLTDTKTLAVALFWLIAFFMRRKSRWWALAALLFMIAIYLVPHSLLGSELDYRTGKIVSGS